MTKFRQHYLRYIKPKELKLKRKSYQALHKSPSKVYSRKLLWIFLAILFLAAIGNSSFFIDLLIAVPIILLIWFRVDPLGGKKVNKNNSNRALQHTSDIKKEIFPNIVSFFGSSFRYYEKSGLNIRELQKNSLVIPSYSYAEMLDSVEGRFSGVDFRLLQVRLKSDNGDGSRDDETIFSGVIIMLGMNKNFVGTTVIKHDKGAVLNYIEKGDFRGCERVKLEDLKFEKLFEVYSTNQVEARYLLDPAFMERLLYLADLFNTKLEASFSNNQLILLLNTEDELFDVRNFPKQGDLYPAAKAIVDKMQAILQIIEILKLRQGSLNDKFSDIWQ